MFTLRIICLLLLYSIILFLFYPIFMFIDDFLLCIFITLFFFFFKQKTAYEMRISDWSSDVCSSDLQMNTLVLSMGELLQRSLNESIRLDMQLDDQQIGRASCRERVCQYV